MRFKIQLSLWAIVMMLSSLTAQKTFNLSSPNKGIALQLTQSAAGAVTYSVNYKGKAAIKPSALGFTLSSPKLSLKTFTVVSCDSSTTDETWIPVWGETSKIRNHYKQLNLQLKDKGKSGILMTVIFKVFDDGIGFRYDFPKQPNLNHFVVADEHTQFALGADHKAFWIPGDYDSNEYCYNTTKLSAVNAFEASKKEPSISTRVPFDANAVQTPLMLKTAAGVYINIHEAALVNYPAMNLVLNKATFTLTSHLVPDAVGNKAYLQTPAVTPWRTIVISDKATEVLASKIILNLNEPSKLDATNWIKPQKFVGVWWEMHVDKSTWYLENGKHGANTANVKQHIDFAAKYGFDGVLVEGWNTGWEDWFGNWKEEVFDFITPYPDYNIDELTAYAKSKGVKIIMHHETSGSVTNYERRMEKAYDYMTQHNMNTVKTGYVGRIIPRGEHHDGQWMVNHYVRVAQATADHQIMLDAHEPVRPTGLHRTYPNWMACEAARGQEFNAWSTGNPPEHETILPFTRLMGGPMDYTPGVFHLKLNQYNTGRTMRIHTTLMKQLALYITMYSPFQMIPDLPENYEAHRDAFQFLVDVPVDWDDTKIIAAEPGDYIMTARKAKGRSDWFLGAISDENSREILLNLGFLDANAEYDATIYRDGDKADWDTNPDDYLIEHKSVNQNTTLTLHLAKGGGCAIRFTKK